MSQLKLLEFQYDYASVERLDLIYRRSTRDLFSRLTTSEIHSSRC